MKKLMRAYSLLGLAFTPREAKDLTAREQQTILQLLEKEYGINIAKTSDDQLMNMSRKPENTRYFNHLFEGGRFYKDASCASFI